jgi:ABC-type transporter MlaC component
MWYVYRKESGEFYSWAVSARGAKIIATRQNKVSDFYRNQGIWPAEQMGTFAVAHEVTRPI